MSTRNACATPTPTPTALGKCPVPHALYRPKPKLLAAITCKIRTSILLNSHKFPIVDEVGYWLLLGSIYYISLTNIKTSTPVYRMLSKINYWVNKSDAYCLRINCTVRFPLVIEAVRTIRKFWTINGTSPSALNTGSKKVPAIRPLYFPHM